MLHLDSTLAPLRHRDFRRLWTGYFLRDGRPVDTTGDARLGRLRGHTLAGAARRRARRARDPDAPARAAERRTSPTASTAATRSPPRSSLMVVISLHSSMLLALNAVQAWHLFLFSIFRRRRGVRPHAAQHARLQQRAAKRGGPRRRAQQHRVQRDARSRPGRRRLSDRLGRGRLEFRHPGPLYFASCSRRSRSPRRRRARPEKRPSRRGSA